MTVSSSTSKIIGSGNGATTAWPFSFPVFDETHLQVIYTDAAGDESTLNASLYTVSLNGDQALNPGGSVTYAPAIASGTKLTILRVVPYTQETDVKNQGGFFPEVLERGFDLIVMQVQQIKEQLARAFKLSPSQSAIGELEAADASRANTILGFGPSGLLTLFTGVASSAVSLAMQPVIAAASLAAARTAMGVPGLGANTFTGAQTLPGNATNALEAVPKQQADSIAAAAVPIGAVLDWPTDVLPSNYLWADGSLVSRTTYAALFGVLVTAPNFTGQTFTVTIASPGVVTKNGHGFNGGERLRLSTTGALPTGLDTTSDFFVIWVDANTFKLATSETNAADGTAITTTGSQSGTHTYTRSLYGLGDGSTNFRLPDLRDVYARGKPASGATVGSYRRDAMQGHYHFIFETGFGDQTTIVTYNQLAQGVNTLAGGNPAGTAGAALGISGPRSDGTNGTPRLAGETRPVTRYVNKIIRYQ